jgi:hypothetical protein
LLGGQSPLTFLILKISIMTISLIDQDVFNALICKLTAYEGDESKASIIKTYFKRLFFLNRLSVSLQHHGPYEAKDFEYNPQFQPITMSILQFIKWLTTIQTNITISEINPHYFMDDIEKEALIYLHNLILFTQTSYIATLPEYMAAKSHSL